jgi:GT2 family glycosyltransferase
MVERLTSIIVPAWRGGNPPPVSALIHSVTATVAAPHEIVVVCNGQDASLRDWLSGEPAATRVAYVSQNTGVARGWNVGVHLALGEWLVFVNEDVLLGSGCVDALVETLRADPSAGMVGPRGAQWEVTADSVTFKRFVEDEREPATVVCGFLFAMPRQAVVEAGGFDDEMAPCSFEELDMAEAVRRAGRRLVVRGGLSYRHEWGVSEWNPDLTIDYLGRSESIRTINLRNEARFLRKWAPAQRAAPLATAQTPDASNGSDGSSVSEALADALAASGLLPKGGRVLDVSRTERAVARPLEALGYLVTTEVVHGIVQPGQFAARLEAIVERFSNGQFDVALAVGAFGPLTDPEALLLARVLGQVAGALVVVETASGRRDLARGRTRPAWLRLLAKAEFGLSRRESGRVSRRLSAIASGRDQVVLVFRDLRTAGRLRRAWLAAVAELGGRRAAAAAWRELNRPGEDVRGRP